MDGSGEDYVGDGDEVRSLLRAIERHLAGFDSWRNGLATEEDVIILRCLQEAVSAARRKGYSEDLLVQVLRGVVRA